MMKLSELSNTTRPSKKVRRLGRGMGSKRGKTCGKGNKGDKARQGYKYRFGEEGGQLPLYKKIPTRGFSNARFTNQVFAINLGTLDKLFKDGDIICLEALQALDIAPRLVQGGLKILSNGELTKKVTIQAVSFSAAAIEKLNAAGISFQQIKAGKNC